MYNFKFLKSKLKIVKLTNKQTGLFQTL